MDTDEESHFSESSQEVDALNQLLTTFTIEDEEEEDFEIGGVGNPTKEDLQKLLSLIQMKQIRVEQSRFEKSMQKLTAQQEDLLSAITQECEDIRKDITSIQQSLTFGYEEDEAPQDRPWEPLGRLYDTRHGLPEGYQDPYAEGWDDEQVDEDEGNEEEDRGEGEQETEGDDSENEVVETEDAEDSDEEVLVRRQYSPLRTRSGKEQRRAQN
ncbi:hypothetical protein BGZ81_001707 [Podila clonocystis]|nr:hypothetical protein BGZ81_001707 [Podila clonocystis]